MKNPSEDFTHKDRQIIETKQMRKDLSIQYKEISTWTQTEEVFRAKTRLKESIMWLGERLHQLGSPTPYPESKNPENTIIHEQSEDIK